MQNGAVVIIVTSRGDLRFDLIIDSSLMIINLNLGRYLIIVNNINNSIRRS